MLQIYFIKKNKLQSENNQTMPAYQFKNQSFKYERGKTTILKLCFQFQIAI